MTFIRHYLFVFIACLGILSCKEDCEDPLPETGTTPTDGLVAHYRFNGNANDETQNNLDGIVHGALPAADRKGVPQAAYSFDGINDYINVPHNNLLNLSGDYSISLWTNVASTQEAEGGINDILRKWNGDAQGYPFAISYLNSLAEDSQEDKILYARYDGQICANNTTTHSSTVTNDAFLHIVMVKQGSKIRTYTNNELIAEVTDVTSCATGNQADMTIGCRGNLVRFFRGTIDDIRIYDRALSVSEISSLYEE